MLTIAFQFRLVENTYGAHSRLMSVEVGPGGSVESIAFTDRYATEDEINTFLMMMGHDRLSKLYEKARPEMYPDEPRKDDCTLAKNQIEYEMMMKTEDL